MGGDGFGDGEVAVHADETEEQHAAVEADLVNGVHGLAHRQAQHPFSHGVGCPEGQRQSKEQVCKGQVEQVHVGHGLETLEVEEGEDDQQVARQPQGADDGVEGGHEPEAELTVGFLPTQRSKVVIIRTGVVIFRVVDSS